MYHEELEAAEDARIESRTTEILSDPELLANAVSDYLFKSEDCNSNWDRLIQRLGTAREGEWEVLRNEFQTLINDLAREAAE